MPHAIVEDGGLLTLPPSVLERLGLVEGSRVGFEELANGDWRMFPIAGRPGTACAVAPHIYRYVITVDTGMAPAVDQGMISLATCKPVLRKSAAPGDWVMGCHAAPAPAGLIAWAGKVARKLSVGDYEREFRGRADAVYRELPDGSFEALKPSYHTEPKQREKDLSGPVLVFDAVSSWYFGEEPRQLPDTLMHLAPRGQGHRVNGAAPEDSDALSRWLHSLSPPGVLGQPPDRDASCDGGRRLSSNRPGGC